MELVLQIISWALILIGAFALICGAVGIIRFPDIYTRMHAASITDTLGSASILFALIFQSDTLLVSVKLGLILIFIFVTSPTSSFSLVHAALSSGVEPKLKHDLRELHPTEQDENQTEN